MKTTYLVKLHRVNPVTRCCDDSGRLSEFYTNSSIHELKVRAKNALHLNMYDDFFDFDKDVYFISIHNCNTHKVHYVV